MEELKTKVTLHKDGISNSQSYEHPATTGEDTSMNAFIQGMQIKILSLTDEVIKFDIIGIEPALANALRRIMIAEVPTMAIEKVRMW
jgi:DNA-directed RNA polymerase I and III subunit RPAC1